MAGGSSANDERNVLHLEIEGPESIHEWEMTIDRLRDIDRDFDSEHAVEKLAI